MFFYSESYHIFVTTNKELNFFTHTKSHTMKRYTQMEVTQMAKELIANKFFTNNSFKALKGYKDAIVSEYKLMLAYQSMF